MLSWTVTVSNSSKVPKQSAGVKPSKTPEPAAWRRVVDGFTGDVARYAVYPRVTLKAGMSISGPALIVEDETTTLVPPNFDASINRVGFIILRQHNKR